MVNKVVYFDESIVVVKGDPEVMLKKATVYWDYDNIVQGLNDEVTFDGRKVGIQKGAYNKMAFTVRGNNGAKVGSVLMELYVG